MNRIRKGDKVRIISGKLKGKEGIVLKVFPRQSLAIVDGLNVAKLHRKQKAGQQKSGIFDKEMPMPCSKLALVVAKSKSGISKIRYSSDGKKKVRIAKSTDTEIGAKK